MIAPPAPDLAALGLKMPGDLGALVRILEAQTTLTNAGTCSHPLRLVGGRDLIEAGTGQLLDTQTGREITVSCGNRRASVCEYCSTLYKYDAYNLVAAGLRGGKDVPASVAAHPLLFVTFTAPSFGPVHLGPEKKTGHLRPCHPRRDATGCRTYHRASDPLIGTPLDPASYDYTGHVLFNALAGTLWSVTMTEIRRTAARLAGLTRAEFTDTARISFAKVAEYQTRGLVHFHAVIRLDGPHGPTTTPPTWASTELLEHAVRQGTHHATTNTPHSPQLPARTLTWGRQLDIRPITSADTELDATGLTDTAVARYIAKYATKSAEDAGVELPRIACRTCHGTGHTTTRDPDMPTIHPRCATCTGHGRTLDLDPWDLTDHARTLIETCWHLGNLPGLEELKLRQWAHMLGFRGHFATKSRTYSTTFGALRQERADYTAHRDPETAALADSPDILIINHWRFAGPADTTPAYHLDNLTPSADQEGDRR
jgi:hypothetical protein